MSSRIERAIVATIKRKEAQINEYANRIVENMGEDYWYGTNGVLELTEKLKALEASVEELRAILKTGSSVPVDVEESCPVHLMDGRNEIRCWYPKGHEGECR